LNDLERVVLLPVRRIVMTTTRSTLSTLALGLLGISTALGCSDDGGAEPGSAGGSTAAGGGGSGATAGAATSGGQGGASGGGAGLPGTSGASSTGGSAAAGAAGAGGTPNSAGAGGASGGGTGGSAVGGASGAGGSGGGSAGAAGMPAGGAGGQGSGTCTASKSTGRTVTGTGPHEVVIETNSENGIKCGTIYRPKDLGGAEKYPILVWGEGGCGQNGYDNIAALGEIASWGYFIVADGTPNSTNACAGGQNGKAFLDYITWAIAENGKACSAYHQSLETTKIAADGFSCGGLMAANVSGDPRFTAIGITSSGLMSANDALYDKIHTPYKIMNGGSSDIAYQNGLRDYDEISSRGKPIIYFSKSSAGHGGDLGQARGDFNKVNLAWLNWQLKGDMGATGKGFLQGATCTFCTASGWTYKAANLP
jgi:dienelactone hydrolase